MAVFPSAVATDADLLLAKNNTSSNLREAITTTSRPVTVKVTTGTGSRFSVNESIVIDSEELRITAITVDDLTATTIDSTTAATHTNLAAVSDFPVALHHNATKDEVKAVEGFLGAPGATVDWQDRLFENFDHLNLHVKSDTSAFEVMVTHSATADRTVLLPDRDMTIGNAADLTGIVPLASLSGITNTQIAAGAGIVYSKLSLTGAILNADINASAAIAWTKLDKTGSSLADLTTRSASDLSSGTLANARLAAALSSHTYEGLTITTTTGTLTVASAKTLTANSNLTLTGTDGKSLTVNASLVLAGTDAKTLTLSADTTLATNSITLAGTEVLTLAAAKNVTFADAFSTSGAFSVALTATGTTTVTLPTTGTLSTLAGTEVFTNKTLTAPTINGTVMTTGLTLPAHTLGGNIAAGTNKITGLGQGTASGEALSAGRSVATGTGLSGGGDLTTDRTIILADTAVSAGTYYASSITVDAQGRLTSAATPTTHFLLQSADVNLPQARTITAGTKITLTDAGAGSTLTASWDGLTAQRTTSSNTTSTGSFNYRTVNLKEGTGISLTLTDDAISGGVVTYLVEATGASSAGGWTDDGSVVRLTTASDQVGIGTASPNASYKVHIVGTGSNLGLLVDDNIAWKSGASGIAILDHAFAADQTVTFPDPGGADSIVYVTLAQTLAGKTLTAPVLSGSVTGTYTLAGTPTLGATLAFNSQTVSGNGTFSGQVSFTNATAPIIAAKLGPVSGQQHTLPSVASDTIALIAASQSLTNKTATATSNHITAEAVFSATTTVNLAAATAPTTGQVLTATSSTAATWQTLSTGTFTVITGDTTGVVQTRYIADKASQLVLTLPAVYSQGDYIFILGKGAGGWKVTAATGDVIKFDSTLSTSSGGSVASGDVSDYLELVCTAANDTWTAAASRMSAYGLTVT